MQNMSSSEGDRCEIIDSRRLASLMYVIKFQSARFDSTIRIPCSEYVSGIVSKLDQIDAANARACIAVDLLDNGGLEIWHQQDLLLGLSHCRALAQPTAASRSYAQNDALMASKAARDVE